MSDPMTAPMRQACDDYARGVEDAARAAKRLNGQAVEFTYYIEAHDDLSSMGASIRVPRSGPYVGRRRATIPDVVEAILALKDQPR